jgi:ABC-type transport system involved in multi-copper enzyme maturation permease subunit
MDIKGLLTSFFKPTFWILIIGFILFVCFVPFVYYDTGIRCITGPCLEAGETGSLLTYILFSYHLRIYTYGTQYFMGIAGLLAAYVVSCGIVFLYKKFKK